MNQRDRSKLLRELVDVKDRLRRHGTEVAYNRDARTLKEHVVDIKRRDEIERLLEAKVVRR